MEKKNRIVLPVYDMSAKKVEEIELDPHVFDGEVNKTVLYQAITAFRANLRRGLAQTKTRGEVSGGGKKPWKQKGTGRARVGSTRSPLWRHGGVVFGPHPRDFSQDIPKGIKSEALRSSLNAKIAAGTLTLVEKFHVLNPKTKEFVKAMDHFKLGKDTVLCVIDAVTENIKRSTSNIRHLRVMDPSTINALDVVNVKKILMSRDSLKIITKRLKNV
jgi:large subunit ribosomal protein L4